MWNSWFIISELVVEYGEQECNYWIQKPTCKPLFLSILHFVDLSKVIWLVYLCHQYATLNFASFHPVPFQTEPIWVGYRVRLPPWRAWLANKFECFSSTLLSKIDYCPVLRNNVVLWDFFLTYQSSIWFENESYLTKAIAIAICLKNSEKRKTMNFFCNFWTILLPSAYLRKFIEPYENK